MVGRLIVAGYDMSGQMRGCDIFSLSAAVNEVVLLDTDYTDADKAETRFFYVNDKYVPLGEVS